MYSSQGLNVFRNLITNEVRGSQSDLEITSYFSRSRSYALPNFCLCSQTSQCGYDMDVLSPEHEAAPQGPSFASYQYYPPSLCHLAEWGTEAWLCWLLASMHVGGSDVLQVLYQLSSLCAVISCLSALPFTILPLPQKGTSQLFHIYNTSRRPMWNVLNIKTNRSYAERMQYFQE